MLKEKNNNNLVSKILNKPVQLLYEFDWDFGNGAGPIGTFKYDPEFISTQYGNQLGAFIYIDETGKNVVWEFNKELYNVCGCETIFDVPTVVNPQSKTPLIQLGMGLNRQ